MDLYEVASECSRRNRQFSIATIVATSGRTPRKEGRMLILPNGSTYGTIGGGDAEREVIELAQRAMADGKGALVHVKVKESGSEDVFIDVPVKGRRTVIFGTGHIATSLAKVLFEVGFEILFVDENAMRHGFQVPPSMAMLSPSDINSSVLDSRTAVVFSNPDDRDTYMDRILETDCPYIGVLSSRSRATIDNPRVHQPIGFDIGAQTPEEIAISIAAQILAVLNNRL